MLESAAMPKTTRVSVTVEQALLDEFRELAGESVKLSAIVSEALRDEIRRLGMLAYLDEREREHPISPEEREAGERLWRAIESSWTPVPCRCSPREGVDSSSPSDER